VANCKGRCLTPNLYSNDAIRYLHYWDKLGYKRCQNCSILIPRDKYPEIRCKCCSDLFRLRCRVANQRKGKKPIIDHSKLSCVICGFEFKEYYNIHKKPNNKHNKIYRFSRKVPGLYICPRCYARTKSAMKRLDKTFLNERLDKILFLDEL
jgi:hypothetical protein